MAARRFRGRRGLAIIVGLAAILIHIGAAIEAWRSPKLSQAMAWTYVADAVLWIPWAAIGVLVATIALDNSVDLLVQPGGEVPSWYWPATAVTGLIAAGSYLRASQLFPRALTREDVLSPAAKWRWLPFTPALLAALLRPWAIWVLVGAWVCAMLLAPDFATSVGSVVIVLLGAAYWRMHLWVGNATIRHRVTWLLQSALAFARLSLVISALMPLMRAAGANHEVGAYVLAFYRLLLAIAGCGSLAMAVFSAGAFNPSFVVRSTLAYGAAISLLLFALNIITSALVDIAVGALGLSDRLVAAALGTVAGLLLEPVAKILRRLLERTTPAVPEP